MKIKAQFNIPTKIFTKFKQNCQEDGRTMTGAIVMLIKIWLKGLKRGE